MTPARTLLDAIAPIDGYRFASGVWLTHDVNVHALNRWLLPALGGVQAQDPGMLAAAAAGLSEGALLVCAAADRIQASGILPHVIHILPVHGRRQHAKAAVLRYDRVAGASGPTHYWLTIITSANLTHAGLTSNRELVAVERLDPGSGGDALAPAVLNAVPGLYKDIPVDRLSVLKGRVDAFRGALNPKLRPNPAVLHSLSSKPQRAFPAQIKTGPADRLLLVGPAFAANSSDVVSLLGPLVGSETQVDLVVDGGASVDDIRRGKAGIQVPKGLLSGLEASAASVRVHATPADPVSGARSLHAKSILVQRGEQVTQMIGSANLTRRGLAGENRELVLLMQWRARAAVDDEMRSCEAMLVPRKAIQPVRGTPNLPPQVAASAAPVLVEFTPDPGQHAGLSVIHGVLTFVGATRGFVTIDGQEHAFRDGQLRVALDPAAARVCLLRRGKEQQLLVMAVPDDPAAYWAVPSDITTRRTDPMLALLLHDADRATQGPRPNKNGGRTKGSLATDSAFRLPGNVRLNVLTRHRGALNRFDRSKQDDIVAALFYSDPEEMHLAQLIVETTRGDQPKKRDRIEAALIAALRNQGATL